MLLTFFLIQVSLAAEVPIASSTDSRVHPGLVRAPGDGASIGDDNDGDGDGLRDDDDGVSRAHDRRCSDHGEEAVPQQGDDAHEKGTEASDSTDCNRY